MDEIQLLNEISSLVYKNNLENDLNKVLQCIQYVEKDDDLRVKIQTFINDSSWKEFEFDHFKNFLWNCVDYLDGYEDADYYKLEEKINFILDQDKNGSFS